MPPKSPLPLPFQTINRVKVRCVPNVHSFLRAYRNQGVALSLMSDQRDPAIAYRLNLR